MYTFILNCLFFVCILRCGPVSRFWCMRFEAKHSYFKSLAHRVKCFKNIQKTLADRHQHLMCYHLSNPNSSPFVKGMKTGKGIVPVTVGNLILFSGELLIVNYTLTYFATNLWRWNLTYIILLHEILYYHLCLVIHCPHWTSCHLQQLLCIDPCC